MTLAARVGDVLYVLCVPQALEKRILQQGSECQGETLLLLLWSPQCSVGMGHQGVVAASGEGHEESTK